MVMPGFPPLHHNREDAPFVPGKERRTSREVLGHPTSCVDFASQEKHITMPAPQKSAVAGEIASLSICMAMGRLCPQGVIFHSLFN